MSQAYQRAAPAGDEPNPAEDPDADDGNQSAADLVARELGATVVEQVVDEHEPFRACPSHTRPFVPVLRRVQSASALAGSGCPPGRIGWAAAWAAASRSADGGDRSQVEVSVSEGASDMSGLLAHAQQMQRRLVEAQETIAQTEVSGSAGGGLVTARRHRRRRAGRTRRSTRGS